MVLRLLTEFYNGGSKPNGANDRKNGVPRENSPVPIH
jgi:hypothetical protein